MKKYIITMENIDYFDYEVMASSEEEANEIILDQIMQLTAKLIKQRDGSFEIVDCKEVPSEA